MVKLQEIQFTVLLQSYIINVRTTTNINNSNINNNNKNFREKQTQKKIDT